MESDSLLSFGSPRQWCLVRIGRNVSPLRALREALIGLGRRSQVSQASADSRNPGTGAPLGHELELRAVRQEILAPSSIILPLVAVETTNAAVETTTAAVEETRSEAPTAP